VSLALTCRFRARDGRDDPGQPVARRARRPRRWIQALLATPVVLWGGWPFFARGYASLVSRHLNMFTLIALGTGAAWGYSAAAVLVPGAFPDSFRDPHGGMSRCTSRRPP
jgi:cation transport ATPase